MIDFSQARVLVTGAAGFIGSRLVARLTACGMAVHGVSRRAISMPHGTLHVGSCSDWTFISTLLRQLQPEFVVHLASRTKPGRELDDFEPQVADTVLPALNVARALPSSVRLAVFFGSCEEYGHAEPPFVEEQQPIVFSPYGWAKTAAREGVFLSSQLTGAPVCWVRPFLTFGPGQRAGLFVPDLIRACLAGDSIDLTAGEQTRDFIYVDDVCGMTTRLFQHAERGRGEILNFCSGHPRTIRSVGEAIADRIGRGTLGWGRLPYRATKAMRFYGSTEKFRRLLGDYPVTPFSEAIAATIAQWPINASP